MKLIKTVMAFVILLTIFQTMMMVPYAANASDDLQEVMRVNVPLAAGAEEYLSLLEYPSFVAMAIDNSGIELGILDNINVISNKDFSWSGVSIEFIKKDGQLFIYDAKLIASFGKVLPKIRLALDTANVGKGLVVVNVYSKYASLLPQEFASRFEPKLLKLFNVENQKHVLQYLQKFSNDNRQKDGRPNIGELILIDGYNDRALNRSVTPYSEVQNNKFGKITLLLYVITAALITIPFYVLKRAKKLV